MVNYGLMIGMLMAVGLLFWVATRHWDHALKQLQSKYNELSRLEMTTHSDELEPDEKADLSRRIICNVPIVTHVGTRQGQTIVSDSA